MPAHDNHTQPHRIPSVPATRRTRSGSPRPDPRPRRERVRPSTATASVDVASADLTAPGDTVDGRIGMLAAAALRGGGILAVLTRGHHQPTPGAALADPTGAIVAAAQNADLLYLQHIVIPTGVIP